MGEGELTCARLSRSLRLPSRPARPLRRARPVDGAASAS